jgi:hypothetical protein
VIISIPISLACSLQASTSDCPMESSTYLPARIDLNKEGSSGKVIKEERAEDLESHNSEGSLGADHDKEDDDLSASHCDDSVTTIDIEEVREKQVRRSLLFAILTACGQMFCISMIGKLIQCFSRSSDDGGAEVDVAALGHHASGGNNST